MSGIIDLNRLSQTQVAELWGCSTRTIQRLPELPTLRHGSGQDAYYVWSECRAVRDAHLTQGAGGELSHGDRLKKIKADDAELDLALKQGSLADAVKVREVWACECAAMRARLLSIPATAAVKISPSMTQAQREGIIREDIYEALESLSGARP